MPHETLSRLGRASLARLLADCIGKAVELQVGGDQGALRYERTRTVLQGADLSWTVVIRIAAHDRRPREATHLFAKIGLPYER